MFIIAGSSPDVTSITTRNFKISVVQSQQRKAVAGMWHLCRIRGHHLPQDFELCRGRHNLVGRGRTFFPLLAFILDFSTPACLAKCVVDVWKVFTACAVHNETELANLTSRMTCVFIFPQNGRAIALV